MIQIYSPANTDYTKNGDMTLMATRCDVHAVLNGAWELELSHPIDADGRWKYIEGGAVISAPSFNGNQLFRIKETDKDDSGVTATAEPIFMDARDDCFLVDVRPTDKTGQQALDIMTAPNSKYTGSSNITKIATAYYQFKNLIEAINGNDDNSFVKRWGGEIYFNNYQIIINNQVGGDYGVSVLYGKNASKNGVSETIDTSDIITRIYPKAYNGYTMTNNGYVDSPLINTYPVIKARTITFDNVKMREDANEDDEENGIIICDTQEELDDALEEQCQAEYEAGADKPKVTISVDMVLVENTVNYAEYKGLETVSLGDTVHCKYYRLGIVTDARVREITYDCLRQRTTKVVIGDEPYQYFNNVSSGVNRIDGAIRPDGSLIAEQIQGFINSAYAQLRLQNSVAQKQDVRAILFEDLDPSSDLFGAISIGTQGLQIADSRTSDGRDWDWGTAITAKGMNASLITVGLISANMVRAGVLASQNNRLKFDLDNALLQTFDANGNITMEFTERGLSFIHGGVTLLEISSDDAGNVNFAWRGSTGKLAFRRESTAYPIEEFLTIYPYDMGPDQEGGVHTFHLYPYSIDMNGENVGSSSSKGSISNVNSISVWGEITAVRNNRNVYAVLSAPSGEDRVLQIGIESGSNLTLHGTAQTFYIAITSSDEMLKDNIADTAEQALPQVNAIRHRSFTWKEGAVKEKLGYVAQELEKINARWVDHVPQPDGEDMVQPRIDRIVPYLSKAIQELSARIDELERKVNADGN